MPPLEWTVNMVKSSIPATTGVFLGPVKRPRSAEDDFFDAGNVQRALQCKLSVYALEDDGITMLEDDRPAYECMFKDCNAKFSSLSRHEAHYETSHRNLCSSCGRSFPSYRLLDLHLSEEHDSFFRAMAERKPMYLCLVEGCAEVFLSTEKRHGHLVEVHRYPENFDFGRASYTRKNARRSSQRASTIDGSGCRIVGRRRKKEAEAKTESVVSDRDAQHILNGTATATTGAVSRADQPPVPGLNSGTKASALLGNDFQGTGPHDVAGMEVEPAETGQSHRAVDATSVVGTMRPAPSRSGKRVCKFWGTASGCRAGSACKFRHNAAQGSGASWDGAEEATGKKAGAEVATAVDACVGGGDGGRATRVGVSEEMDASDVDEIVEGMRQVKLLVPTHLSFGRSARRGKPIIR